MKTLQKVAVSLSLVAGMLACATFGGEAQRPEEAAASSAKAPAPQAVTRARLLKENIESLTLNLTYQGPVANHYFNMNLLVGGASFVSASRYNPWVMVTASQAVQVVDYLATEGFLDRASDAGPGVPAASDGPRYTLTVNAEPQKGRPVGWSEDLGWGIRALSRLEALERATTDHAAGVMKELTATLRKEFAPPGPNPAER